MKAATLERVRGLPSDLDRLEPWLTVVIPSHMDGHWLSSALASLAAQTRRDFECIIVDSSTDDAIARIAESFMGRLHLRLESRSDLAGWQRKTNHGVAKARAPFFSMLHPDDLWEPNRAERVAAWLSQDPASVMHLHPSWIVDERRRRLALWRCPLPVDVAIAPALFTNRLIVQNFIAICAPVVRRDAFLDVGGFDPHLWYTGDWDLYLKLGRTGAVRYHHEPLASYRIHRNAMTISGTRDAAAYREQLWTVMQKHLALFEEAPPASVTARSHASFAVNLALAGALHGRRGDFVKALWSVLRLGPCGIVPFLRDTRLIERVVPRARAWLRPSWSRGGST